LVRAKDNQLRKLGYNGGAKMAKLYFNGKEMVREDARIQRQIQLPFSEALRISFQSLKIRFWRSVITTAGILLGIAFLVAVMASSAIDSNMQEFKGRQEIETTFMAGEETEEGVSATEIWLIVMSLIVCVVGIANSMLMAVTERFREIGTMKCLGALDRFVVELFLLESGFQGLAGAIVGALIGCIVTILFSLKKHGLDLFGNFPLLSPRGGVLGIIALGALIGMILAVIGAAGPAYTAAKMPPAEAMRVEV